MFLISAGKHLSTFSKTGRTIMNHKTGCDNNKDALKCHIHTVKPIKLWKMKTTFKQYFKKANSFTSRLEINLTK